jgi:hypothetical protein
MTTCELCRYFLPNKINPNASVGRCRLKPEEANYPTRKHHCEKREERDVTA